MAPHCTKRTLPHIKIYPVELLVLPQARSVSLCEALAAAEAADQEHRRREQEQTSPSAPPFLSFAKKAALSAPNESAGHLRHIHISRWLKAQGIRLTYLKVIISSAGTNIGHTAFQSAATNI